MKKMFYVFATLILFVSCSQSNFFDEIIHDVNNEAMIEQTSIQSNVQYDENGNEILDIIPTVQPFINEGCQTAWDNLSAIVNSNGQITYMYLLPDYTPTSNDLDKQRFQFFYQVQNQWFGLFDGEEPYTLLGSPTFQLMAIDTYGDQVCQGLQEIRIWVHDELTDKWYMNSQVVLASFLCGGQMDCGQGWEFDDLEYTPYTSGYLFMVDGPISGQ
jgi:hypothetical protein